IIAAAAFYFLCPPVYESDAKLLVRYVLERSAVDPIDGTKPTFQSSNDSDRVIGAEIEILTSWDLAMQVAQAIGPKRLLAPAPVRARLNQTEDALKSLRDKTGVVSLKDGSTALTAEAAKTQEDLNAAEAELAEGKALVKQTAENKSKKWKSQPSEKSPESKK